MDIVTGQGGDVTRAEIIMPMSSKTCSMKHWARRTITKKQESMNNDGVVLGIQVKGCYEIHKLDVEQYVNDNMMLSLVNSDGASDTIIKTYLMGPAPAVLFSLETSGYRPTLTICPAQTIILTFILLIAM